MITSRAFAGKSYCVLGLARSGLASVEALLAGGANVTAWDRREEPREALAGRVTIADPLEIDLTQFEAIIVSPGVPLNSHPLAAKAREVGVPVIGDIELFAQARADMPRHKIVGITGTNGKSTVTALLHHMLERAGVPARMGGNIGLPILAQEALESGGIYVLELSSYQIDLTYSLACDCATLINVSPDHLDRYDDGFAGYAASKERLFTMQESGQFAIFGCDDEPTCAVQEDQSKRRPIGRAICVDSIAREWASHQDNWPSLQGPHNLQNALIVAGLAAELGLSRAQIMRGLSTFGGLPHRMERIATCGGITFINDSKATNPASTAPALAAFPPVSEPRIHWICGGLPKEKTLDECAAHFGNVARAYTIGDAGSLFAELLAPIMPVENCEMISAAVQKAIANAKSGDVVLFSPACASFDQFRDFEMRGEAFRELVAELGCAGDLTGCSNGKIADFAAPANPAASA